METNQFDLKKYETGEYVNAVEIEQKLSKNKYIEFAVIISENRKYTTALLFVDKEKYENAKKRVKELKGFYSHLASYILIISFLCFINFRFSPEHIWFYWPMLGWGIGLFFHAVGVFNIIPFFGKDWEDKKITEIMEKEKQTKWE